MNIEYKNVHDILKERNLRYPDFGFFSNASSVIKILQWQPKGVLGFEEERGFWCKECLHAKKAKTFLELANKKSADIVITPEYSFPWGVIQEIIDDALLPGNGKLWCLGMEGISCEEFLLFLDKVNKNSSVDIILEDLEDITQNYFFSCLLYLFKSKGRIIIIIQLKTTAASDKWAELEAKGLTKGKTIYLFKGLNSEIYLYSYICADALNQSIEDVMRIIPYQECIILHPQLNPRPKHETFDQMRKNYLNYDSQQTRIISVNWAKDTVLPKTENRHEIKVLESYSAFFGNGEWDATNKDDISQLIKNKEKGIDFEKRNHILVWHMPEEEHCIFYTIDSYRSKMLSCVTSNHKQPLGSAYFEFDFEQEKWVDSCPCNICSIDWKWISSKFGMNKCSSGKCLVHLLYRFFMILLRGTHDPLETVKKVFDKGADTDEHLSILRERCEFVDEALKEGYVPKKFEVLSNGNYSWILNNRGNLSTKTVVDDCEIYCVLFVDSAQEELIKRRINSLKKMLGDGVCDRLIVYYLSRAGIKYYEGHYNADIRTPNNFNNSDIINKG